MSVCETTGLATLVPVPDRADQIRLGVVYGLLCTVRRSLAPLGLAEWLNTRTADATGFPVIGLPQSTRVREQRFVDDRMPTSLRPSCRSRRSRQTPRDNAARQPVRLERRYSGASDRAIRSPLGCGPRQCQSNSVEWSGLRALLETAADRGVLSVYI